MTAKTLTIKKSVYDKLLAIKSEGESFSALFDRLAEKEKPNLLKFAGSWNGLSDEEMKEVAERMEKWRMDASKSFAKRLKAIS